MCTYCSSHALYPLGPVATLRFCHLRPRCVSKQRRTTNVIISDRVWWIWCDAGLATVATRPQRSPHSVASNSRPVWNSWRDIEGRGKNCEGRTARGDQRGENCEGRTARVRGEGERWEVRGEKWVATARCEKRTLIVPRPLDTYGTFDAL